MRGFECLEANFESHVYDWNFVLLYLLCITPAEKQPLELISSPKGRFQPLSWVKSFRVEAHDSLVCTMYNIDGFI